MLAKALYILFLDNNEMKKILFYCQHLLGIGHLVRSLEIVKGLVDEFQVCFINGGEIIEDLLLPEQLVVVNLPALKTDSEFKELATSDEGYGLDEIKLIRQHKLLTLLNQFQPDILIVELFPFGRRQLSFELIPLLEEIDKQNYSTKVVCSLRDITITKLDRVRNEQKICDLMNKYFDLLLVHGDPCFIPLEETFSRIEDLNCPVRYTGYVVSRERTNVDLPIQQNKPSIVVSVGGGRFGHELLEASLHVAKLLEGEIPHQFNIFTGYFIPEDKFLYLQELANKTSNVNFNKYTNNLIGYLKQADLSINMGGYNTTMNILTTGVRSLLLPFTGNGDREQTIRAQKLAELGVLKILQPQDLNPKKLAKIVLNHLQQIPQTTNINLNGVAHTLLLIKQLINN